MDQLETLGVADVAALLRCNEDLVMSFARRGQLPGIRLGKAWVFLREDVLAFLRGRIETETQERLKRSTGGDVQAVLVNRPANKRRRPLPDLSAFLVNAKE